jgi:hypothetical protein
MSFWPHGPRNVPGRGAQECLHWTRVVATLPPCLVGHSRAPKSPSGPLVHGWSLCPRMLGCIMPLWYRPGPKRVTCPGSTGIPALDGRWQRFRSCHVWTTHAPPRALVAPWDFWVDSLAMWKFLQGPTRSIRDGSSILRTRFVTEPRCAS